LDFHGNKDRYFEAKLKLFSICKTAIFNIDDPYARRALGLSRTERSINAGVIWRGDVYATDIENRGLDGISYMYHGKNFIFKMNLRLAGIYNVYNSLLASALAIDMGCKPCEVKKAVESIEEIHGRYEIIKGDVTAIIDYAHTPTAFEAILKELRALAENDELWVVFGCGGQRDREKRPQMARIAEKYTKNIIVTSDNPRDEDKNNIFEDIKRGFSEEHPIIENRKEAIRAALLFANDGDIVAIIGKGPEKYNIDANGYSDFDERKIVENALRERRSII
jgi:UDP-N-acetylmuramoyl-L-alanyl-D-glutamate--2,6-diaminopimelate ligase